MLDVYFGQIWKLYYFEMFNGKSLINQFAQDIHERDDHIKGLPVHQAILGRYTMDIDIKVRIISYCARFLTGKQSKLSFLNI